MQRNFSIFDQGDIVVAVLPFSDQKGSKRRPALVISGTKYNVSSNDLVLLQITSVQKPGKYRVVLSGEGLEDGTLKVESQIKVDSPVAFYKKAVERKIGKITAQKLAEVKGLVSEFYEL